MKIMSYEDITIDVIDQTPNPLAKVIRAAAITQHQFPSSESVQDPASIIKYLFTAEHHSPFEFACLDMEIHNCSRSFLAQITRQRTFTFMSASQHYQDYRDYPCVVHPDLVDSLCMRNGLAASYMSYERLVDSGVVVEEARQVLPNAAAVNLRVKADARNLMYFFRQRRCERNCAEMIYVADAMWAIANRWFPDLFSLVGAPCFNGKCNQGKMQSPKCRIKIDEDLEA